MYLSTSTVLDPNPGTHTSQYHVDVGLHCVCTPAVPGLGPGAWGLGPWVLVLGPVVRTAE